MDIDRIFDSLSKKSIRNSAFFGRKVITVKERDMRKYIPYFKKSLNLFNSKENFRTHECIKHIHAIKNGKYYQAHIDYGNVNRGFIFGLLHLFTDVIPYFIWHLIKWKEPYSFD